MPVESEEIEQWFLRITQYAEELLETLHQLEGGWPERVLTMQRNWIGKSRGARVRFDVEGLAGTSIEVFTTRQDTLFGASFVALSPNHPLAQRLAEHDPGLAEFVAECNRMGTSEAVIEADRHIHRHAHSVAHCQQQAAWIDYAAWGIRSATT